MVKLSTKGMVLALFLGVFVGNVSAQENETASEKIKIKSALSFSAGLLTENTQTIQLHGYIGMRPKQGRIELRGDGFYFLNSFGDRPRFTINHQLYAGAFYRFSDAQFQPYVGLQPGIAYAQSSEYGRFNDATNTVQYKKTINPVGSVTGGLDFFAEKLFFMFIETRYIFGKHKADSYPIFLDEWRFSFGLGFHF
jgi:hypothetical protein